MEAKLKRFFSSYIRFSEGHRLLCFSVAIILLVGAFAISYGLKLRSDLKELLPEKSASVLELDKMLARVGGVSVLTVTVESPNVAANKAFVDALNEKISELPKEDIRYVISKVDAIKEFYEGNVLHYINVPDLEKLYTRLNKLVQYEKFKRTPFFMDFGVEESPITLNVDDIKESNAKNMKMPLAVYDDYYGGEEGRFLILMVRPKDASVSVDKARDLIASVRAIVDELDPSSFDADMKVGFCGNVVSMVEEYDTLKHDMLSTFGLCIALVILVIFLYFLRLRIIAFLGISLIFGVLFTFATTKIFIGYLNAQTAFLASIIVGTGINYGIILLGRYLEERKSGKEPVTAMEWALSNAWLPTFLAAATTAAAFSILMIAGVRGLSQFGFIGSVGVMFCWLTSMFILPPMVLASERVLTLFKKLSVPGRRSALFPTIDRALSHFHVFIVVFCIVVGVWSVVEVVNYVPNSLEYDFSKMRNKMSAVEGTEALERRVAKLWVGSMSPAVVLLERPEDGPEVCSAVKRQNDSRSESDKMVDYCYSVYDLLPKDVDKRAPVLKKFKALLSQKWMSSVGGEVGEQLRIIQRSLERDRLVVKDLPEDLVRNFTDLDGNVGTFAYINPRSGMPLSDGKNLIKFANNVRDISLPDGRVFHATGTYMVFADLLQIVKKEAPVLVIVSFLAVALLVGLLTRKLNESYIIIISLAWAVLVMVACMSLLGLKINFFNFIALPLTFGVGVDYSINVAMRFREGDKKGITEIMKGTGLAVVVCSLTTTVGYYVLTLSANQAVAQFGAVAIIGEITSVFAAIVFLPSMIMVGKKIFRIQSSEKR